MSIKPDTRLSSKSPSFIYKSDPSLQNPLKVSTAHKLDRLLLTPGGQKLFNVQNLDRFRSLTPDNLISVKYSHKSFDKSRPSASFISQSRDSRVTSCFSPTSQSKSKSIKKKYLDKDYLDFIQINSKMEGIAKLCEEEFSNMGKMMPAWKRRKTFEGLKESQKKYQELKSDRLEFIKKQRIMRNTGKYENDLFKINKQEAVGINEERQKSNKNLDIEKIFASDPSVSFKPGNFSSSPLAIKSKPNLTKDESSHFPSRVKKQTEFSNPRRDYNIITGAALN